jgi:hypothetical protein
MANELPRGAVLFRWAALADKFNLTPAQIALLTDAQIDRLLFHKRDRDGGLVPPELPQPPKGPPTRESRLITIDQLEASRLITPAEAAERREEIERRFGPDAPAEGSP